MPEHPVHALHRAVGDLTLGIAKSMRARDARDAEMGLSEIMQQYQVRFSGVSDSAWGFAPVTLTFDFPFFYAPGQRDSDFDRPHFWYGAETTGADGTGAGIAIAFSAVVSAWVEEPKNGAIVGATVQIGVCGTVQAAYEGIAHLTFQGFSALSEDEPDFDLG